MTPCSPIYYWSTMISARPVSLNSLSASIPSGHAVFPQVWLFRGCPNFLPPNQLLLSKGYAILRGTWISLYEPIQRSQPYHPIYAMWTSCLVPISPSVQFAVCPAPSFNCTNLYLYQCRPRTCLDPALSSQSLHTMHYTPHILCVAEGVGDLLCATSLSSHNHPKHLSITLHTRE